MHDATGRHMSAYGLKDFSRLLVRCMTSPAGSRPEEFGWVAGAATDATGRDVSASGRKELRGLLVR